MDGHILPATPFGRWHERATAKCFAARLDEIVDARRHDDGVEVPAVAQGHRPASTGHRARVRPAAKVVQGTLVVEALAPGRRREPQRANPSFLSLVGNLDAFEGVVELELDPPSLEGPEERREHGLAHARTHPPEDRAA